MFTPTRRYTSNDDTFSLSASTENFVLSTEKETADITWHRSACLRNNL